MKYIVIGGVAGGATVAARLRRMDEQAEIILLERGAYVSYANCGLPYYIGGEISERDHLFVQTVKGFQDRFAIDIRVRQEAVEILRDQKAVSSTPRAMTNWCFRPERPQSVRTLRESTCPTSSRCAMCPIPMPSRTISPPTVRAVP